MKVIDPRSGQEVVIGTTVHHPDGESITVLDVKPGLLQASAYVQMTYTDWASGKPTAANKLTWVPLEVRWLHPSYPFQHVAFLPT